jgi:regulator of cell morphogenesis and NO signaling
VATLDTSVRDIVIGDFRAAAVFQQFGIDFCCGGRRTLREACVEGKLDARDVLAQVTAACARRDQSTPAFADWPPDALITYIVGNHHAYVKRVLPAIVAHAHKVAHAHGTTRPALTQVAAVFEQVADEMTSHMAKEEGILFPYISALAASARIGEPAPHAPFGSVDKPIAMMEHEHDDAGRAMVLIRELTQDYTLPADACMTYTTCFQELEEFERDLHVHVHLENNILFPKALALATGAPAAVTGA